MMMIIRILHHISIHAETHDFIRWVQYNVPSQKSIYEIEIWIASNKDQIHHTTINQQSNHQTEELHTQQ